MGLFWKKNKNLTCDFLHFDGLNNIYSGAAISIEQNDNRQQLEFKQRLTKKPSIAIKYSQITVVEVINEEDIAGKGENVTEILKTGELLLGSLENIIQSMSETKMKKYLVINYYPINNPEEIKAISFEITSTSLRWDKFIKSLKEKTGIKKEKESI